MTASSPALALDPMPSSERGNAPRMTNAELQETYRLMLLSRRYDERCNAILATGQEVPHFHSGTGQEALMVGSVVPLKPSDQIIYTHRGYGHLMAKGVSVREIALDTFMKPGGTNHGLGGVMHVSRPDIGVPGREGVFGTRFSIAMGMALASKLDGRDDVVVCYYGEAAGARGILYESLNMAVLWKLPVIYIAENNGWSYSIKTERLYPKARMSRVWRGFDIPVEDMDGNDPEAVYATVSRAVARARAGEGPSVLEGLTYRLDPHHLHDKAAYQSKDEIKAWRQKDPLDLTRQRLIARGLDAATLDAVDRAACHEVETVFAEVEATPYASWTDSQHVRATWAN